MLAVKVADSIVSIKQKITNQRSQLTTLKSQVANGLD